jgi:hypothetical protein
MSAVANSELRHQILEILYRSAQQNSLIFGVDRAKMKELLQVSESQIDFNVIYLKEKGLVELLQPLGKGQWSFARITAFGIDVIEDKDRFKENFPFILTNIQQIYGDVNAPVTQAVGSQVNFEQQVNTAFDQVQILIERKEVITLEQKDEIKVRLGLLKEELKKQEPDVGKIQGLWKWFKQNASWVVPTLSQVVLEGTKLALGK